MTTIARAAGLALASLTLAACGEKPARIQLEPASLRFGVRGQTAKVHATPIARSGKAVPDQVCAWSSTDEAVATASGSHNQATVTAVGPGSAQIRCRIGEVDAAAAVIVRVVARVEVSPARAALKMTDEPAPFPLAVLVQDETGAPVSGRVAVSRCASEEVCRGDARAQLWAVGPGETTAFVEVEGARSTEIAVSVVDARTAEGRPQAVRGNPMEAIEREVRKREAAERKAAERR